MVKATYVRPSAVVPPKLAFKDARNNSSKEQKKLPKIKKMIKLEE